MEEAKRPRLFVSHHSSKYEVAQHVEKALARHGVDCWIAPRDVGPGEAFDSAIMKAIRESAGVLLLFCSQSDKSPHVKRELILADSAHKAIIPLRLEEIVPDDLAYHLASAQWIDWLERRDDSIARIAAKAHQLAGTVAAASAPTAAAADSLHAAILSQAAEAAPQAPPPAAQPASVSIRTLLIVGLGIAVAVLAAMLFMHDADTPKAEVAAPASTSIAASGPPATTATPATDAPATLPAAADAGGAPVSAPPPPETSAPSTPARTTIAPTFNCNRAGTAAEKLICTSDELASLDREMARAYRGLYNVAVKRREMLQTEQSRWRLSVRDSCGDAACMARVMRQRIMTLDERRTEIIEKRNDGAPAAE